MGSGCKHNPMVARVSLRLFAVLGYLLAFTLACGGAVGASAPGPDSRWYVVAFEQPFRSRHLEALREAGAEGGWVLEQLAMVGLHASVQLAERLERIEGVLRVSPADEVVLKPVLQEAAAPAPEPAPVDGRAYATNHSRQLARTQYSVAIVDTGIDTAHPFFKHDGLYTRVLSFGLDPAPQTFTRVPAVAPPEAGDPVGHGTAVAGALLAGWREAQRSVAQRSMPPPALLALQVGTTPAWILEVLAAYEWVLSNQTAYGIRVVNNSWSLSGPFDPHHPVNLATRVLAERGLTVVFAAGNGPLPETLNAFARAPWVIAALPRQVPAGRASDGHPGGRWLLPVSGSSTSDLVNLAGTASARGNALWGPARVDDVPVAGSSGYASFSGSSAAAAFASGWLAYVTEASLGATDRDSLSNCPPVPPTPLKSWAAGDGVATGASVELHADPASDAGRRGPARELAGRLEPVGRDSHPPGVAVHDDAGPDGVLGQ